MRCPVMVQLVAFVLRRCRPSGRPLSRCPHATGVETLPIENRQAKIRNEVFLAAPGELTKDDNVKGDPERAAPRDNVVFSFTLEKGKGFL